MHIAWLQPMPMTKNNGYTMLSQNEGDLYIMDSENNMVTLRGEEVYRLYRFLRPEMEG
jgi:hypothetical protein